MPTLAANAAYSVCERMTKAGFMSGWFGDDSSEFIAEQADGLQRMTKAAFEIWVANQGGNLAMARVSYLDIARLYASK